MFPKKSTEHMKKIPTIILSITYKGVKFIDASNKVSLKHLEAGAWRDKTCSATCLRGCRSHLVPPEATAGPAELLGPGGSTRDYPGYLNAKGLARRLLGDPVAIYSYQGKELALVRLGKTPPCPQHTLCHRSLCWVCLPSPQG